MCTYSPPNKFLSWSSSYVDPGRRKQLSLSCFAQRRTKSGSALAANVLGTSVRSFSGTCSMYCARLHSLSSPDQALQQGSFSQQLHAQVMPGLTSRLMSEVAEVMPESLDLDFGFSAEGCKLGVFDPAKLCRAGSSFSQLWSDCEAVAQSKLESVRPFCTTSSDEEAANMLALQCYQLSELLIIRYKALTRRGSNLDFYCMSTACLKVCSTYILNVRLQQHFTHASWGSSVFALQLVWGLPADESLKAWVCGNMLCNMAVAASNLQMVCSSCTIWTLPM